MDWTHRIRLRQLQVLGSLMLTQNVSRSAEQLNMTQPALSKWLKELEADVGLQLFERHARGLRPTVHGRTLAAFASRINVELDRARDEMNALRDGSSGRVVIGGSGAVVANLVPQAVTSLLQEMPQADVEMVEAPMDRLFQALVNHEIDLAIGRASSKYVDPEVRSEALYVEQLQFAVRPTHPLAGRRHLRWSDLLGQRWVVWTRDIPVRGLLEAALSEQRLAIPPGSIQSNSLVATLELIASNDMIAVVSEWSIEQHVKRKTLRRLPLRLESSSAVTMYWREPQGDNLATQALLRVLREIAGRYRSRRSGLASIK